MGEKDPAFLFYPKDWLSDPNVMAMTLEQKGAYVSLICLCWLQTHIPDDPAKLAAILGVSPGHFEDCIWGSISHCFRASRKPNSLVHKRVERERTLRRGHRLKMSEAGKKGAAKRWGSKGSNSKANAMGVAHDSSASSSSSSSSDKREKIKTPIVPKMGTNGFTEFWEVYPNKKGKLSAEKSWKRIKPDKDLREKILDSVVEHKYSIEWTRENGRYIPHPTTYLNQGRWDDEIKKAPSVMSKEEHLADIERRLKE